MNDLLKEFETYKNQHLNIDLTRGKPCPKQLDLSLDMLDIVNSKTLLVNNGVDDRNYGALEGIKECRELFADILSVPADNIIVFGSSSLNIMHDLLAKSLIKGVCGEKPFMKQESVKWLCPAPGYDRHFAMLESLGIEMITVPMNNDGPDMDVIEEYIKDPTVKGIWCVPKYSNPTGINFSSEVINRLAVLKPAAKDFRIYYDNAYLSQIAFNGEYEEIANIYDIAKENGNEDILYMFTSTSKITFPGSGVSVLAVSPNNKKDVLSYLKYQTIGYDKINQLRHVLFLKDKNNIDKLMKKHALMLKEKCETVIRIFDEEIKDIATYTRPTGGYFISLYVPNKAHEVVAKCMEMGVKLNDAGAFYPYHNDPTNGHIRIAFSYPSIEELELATKIVCLAVKLVK